MAHSNAAIGTIARAYGARVAGLLLAMLVPATAMAQVGSAPNNPLRSLEGKAESAPLREERTAVFGKVRQASVADSRAEAQEEEPPLKYKSEEWLESQPEIIDTGVIARGEYEYDDLGFDEPPVGPFRRAGRFIFRPFQSFFDRPFYHGEPDDPDRYRGHGGPMIGTSWLNRPMSFGVFAGGLFGDQPFNGRVKQGGGFLGGVRFGYDFDHYYGTEFRIAASQLELYNNVDIPLGRTSKLAFFDVNLLYYPWGDSVVRPYISGGLGVAAFNLYDEVYRNYNDDLLLMPLGIGMKVYHNPWSVWRIDFQNNLAFGNRGIDTMHNFSLSAGWEIRYGSTPRLYFPVHSGNVRW